MLVSTEQWSELAVCKHTSPSSWVSPPWIKKCGMYIYYGLFSSVQSFSHVRLFVTPWAAAHQASLSITSSRSSPKPMSIELVMPSNHLILCRPLLLLPSIFPSIKVFSNESALPIKWPMLEFQFQHHSFQWIFRTGWISLLSKGFSRVFLNTTVQMHQFSCTQLSL